MANSNSAFCDAARYDYAHMYEKWTGKVINGTTGDTMTVGDYGREGRRGHRIVTDNHFGPPIDLRFFQTLAPADNTAIMAFAWKRSAVNTPSVGAAPVVIAQFWDTNTCLCSLVVNLNNTLSLIIGNQTVFGASLVATTSEAVPIGNFAHLEWHADISTSAGSSKLYINGSTTEAFSYSGSTGGNAWNVASFGPSVAGATFSAAIGDSTWDYCDIVVRDGTIRAWIDGVHTAAGAQWGDTRVYGLLSEAGNGHYTDWTPLTGTDHGAMVDDAIPDDDTTSNSALPAGLADTYTKEDLPADVLDVLMIQPVHVAKKEFSGVAEIQSRFRTSGVDYDGDETHALSTTYSHIRTVYTAIGGVAITPDDVNNGESGPVTV